MAGVPLAIMVVLGLLTLGPQFARQLAAGNMITREPPRSSKHLFCLAADD